MNHFQAHVKFSLFRVSKIWLMLHFIPQSGVFHEIKLLIRNQILSDVEKSRKQKNLQRVAKTLLIEMTQASFAKDEKRIDQTKNLLCKNFGAKHWIDSSLKPEPSY